MKKFECQIYQVENGYVVMMGSINSALMCEKYVAANISALTELVGNLAIDNERRQKTIENAVLGETEKKYRDTGI